MDDQRFIAWTRRRFGFGLTTAGLAASLVGLTAGADHAVAKRQRKRRKRKRRKQTDPTCAENCPAPCSTCFHRPVGPPLCGNPGQAFCARPCLSDSDCIGTGSPYCYTGSTNRLTNEFSPVDCVNGNTSICIDISPCG